MHRDIKLDNIFVKSKRTLVQGKQDSHDFKIEHYEFKIGDFGLATRCRAQDEFHVTFCGTPLHMAPEVLQRNHPYNQKADVWSLGTILFQMLTGERPYSGKDLNDLNQRVQTSEYAIPRNMLVSPSLIKFLNSCLRIDSKKRLGWDELR